MQATVPFLLKNISKSFGPVKALNDVSLMVRANEVLGLIGENGAGKSTLLKVLAGSLQPDHGEILVGGEKRVFNGPAAAAAAGVGVVHQEQSLIVNLSVAENILMSTGAKHSAERSNKVRFGIYNWKKINEDAAHVLERIGSSVDPRARVDELSFADRQMVEIAKALQITKQPGVQPIIVLDEPTSVLEDEDITQLEDEVKRLKEIGSVIFVSHRLDEVIRVSDRICVLRNGEVVGERPTSDVNEDDLFHLMTGRHAETQSRDRQPVQSLERVVLEVENLSSWHMFWHKFKDISFQVRSGEVHAFLGTNNSGREDVCRAIFGAEGYDTGSVRYKGQPLSKNGLRDNVYEGIGYIPAERKLEGMVAGMTVSENMVLTHPGPSATGPFINEARRRQIAREWIEKLSIRPPNAEADIAGLSGGNQQKVVLAKWLEDPKLALLILDHPTRGIDPGAREDVTKQILLACAKGAGVLLIADTLEEAMAIADTITVMRDGQITARYDLHSGNIPSYEDLVGHMV